MCFSLQSPCLRDDVQNLYSEGIKGCLTLLLLKLVFTISIMQQTSHLFIFILKPDTFHHSSNERRQLFFNAMYFALTLPNFIWSFFFFSCLLLHLFSVSIARPFLFSPPLSNRYILTFQRFYFPLWFLFFSSSIFFCFVLNYTILKHIKFVTIWSLRAKLLQ